MDQHQYLPYFGNQTKNASPTPKCTQFINFFQYLEQQVLYYIPQNDDDYKQQPQKPSISNIQNTTGFSQYLQQTSKENEQQRTKMVNFVPLNQVNKKQRKNIFDQTQVQQRPQQYNVPLNTSNRPAQQLQFQQVPNFPPQLPQMINQYSPLNKSMQPANQHSPAYSIQNKNVQNQQVLKSGSRPFNQSPQVIPQGYYNQRSPGSIARSHSPIVIRQQNQSIGLQKGDIYQRIHPNDLRLHPSAINQPVIAPKQENFRRYSIPLGQTDYATGQFQLRQNEELQQKQSFYQPQPAQINYKDILAQNHLVESEEVLHSSEEQQQSQSSDNLYKNIQDLNKQTGFKGLDLTRPISQITITNNQIRDSFQLNIPSNINQKSVNYQQLQDELLKSQQRLKELNEMSQHYYEQRIQLQENSKLPLPISQHDRQESKFNNKQKYSEDDFKRQFLGQTMQYQSKQYLNDEDSM